MTQVVRRPRSLRLPLLIGLLALAVGVALFVVGQRAPERTLRPVRAADRAELGRKQVAAAFGVKGSGRKRVSSQPPPGPPPEAAGAEVEPPPPKPRPKSRARAKALNARGLAAYRRGLHEDALAL